MLWSVIPSNYVTVVQRNERLFKFIYSEKATKFCEIFTLLLTTIHTVKSKMKILQNFVAFSEYMNLVWLLVRSAIRITPLWISRSSAELSLAGVLRVL